jgi:phosphonatase-like hydrolase
MFQAVLFDVIGTTVKENGDIILAAFEKAFTPFINQFDLQIVRMHRGKDKRVMITEILKQHGYPASLVEQVYQLFKENVEENLDSFSENEGVAEIFDYIKRQKIKLGIGTGLERDIFEKVYTKLKWSQYKFDYIGIAREVGTTRPQPDMIFDMMKKLGLNEKAGFLKVGDTIADIQEGKNAGVFTAAMLSGSQRKEDLEKEYPDFLIESLSELNRILITFAKDSTMGNFN